MSSYLNIYAIDRKRRQCIEIYWCSRSSDIYQAIQEQGVRYIGDITCKEAYAEYRNSEQFLRVKTKEEALEDIPGNEEYNKWVHERFSGNKENGPMPQRKYVGYFIEEEYDALPDKFTMISEQYTELSGDMLNNIVSDLSDEIAKTAKRLEYYKKLAETNEEAINDALDWEEYLEENKQTLDFFKALNALSCELRCGID